MIPKSLCHWLARRYRKHHMAERFEQNFLQLMRQQEELFDVEIFIKNLQQRLQCSITLESIPPQRWLRYLNKHAEREIERWTSGCDFYNQRNVIPLMRWNGLPFVLAYLMKISPEKMNFIFITQDPVFQRLNSMHGRNPQCILSNEPLAVFVFLDERLPNAPLTSLIYNGNRLHMTSVFEDTLVRVKMGIHTLIPNTMPDNDDFLLRGKSYPPDSWKEAIQENLNHLDLCPEAWGHWDDISVLLHG